MAYRIRELREKKKLTQEQLAQMSGVSRTTISTLWVDMLKESMIRSLYRDSDKLIQTEDEQYISRLRSQIDKARTERDRESKKYLRLWKAVRKEFGDEKAWELIEKAEE